MELKNLKIGNKYYLCDMSFHTYQGDKEIYNKHYFDFLKEPLKLLSVGKFEAKNLFNNEKHIYNDVQLLHERTGVILFSRSKYLKESGSESVHYQNNMDGLMPGLYSALAFNFYHGVSKSIQQSNSNLFASKFYITPQTSIKEAQQREFNIKKLSSKEKAQILICKLEDLIEKSLENNDKNKFMLYTTRYNKLKKIYG